MRRVLLAPLFDANSHSGKNRGEIYHHRELTKFLEEPVSTNFNKKTSQTEVLRKKENESANQANQIFSQFLFLNGNF